MCLFIYFFSVYLTIDSSFYLYYLAFTFHTFLSTYSRRQKKVGQCFFANVSLFTISMVTIKIFIYLL
jgi:hypothetical protein